VFTTRDTPNTIKRAPQNHEYRQQEYNFICVKELSMILFVL